MITLSVCLIVKNEEDVLERCLACAKKIADEIVVVDTGSVDKTKEIAKSFTKNVFDFKWCQDFAAARNFSFSKATMDYQMWLDADDVIDEEDCQKILKLKQELNPKTDMVLMKYQVAFDKDENPTLSYFRERIFRRSCQYKWVGEIHEVIPFSGILEYKQINIKHKKLHPTEEGRNLKIFENIIKNGKTLDPRQSYYYGRELMHSGRHQLAVQQLTSFLSGGMGWVENKIEACKDLFNCLTILGSKEKAVEALFKSFQFDTPRAEICCDIGAYFISEEKYQIAAYWYSVAASCHINEERGGFCLKDCYGYIPFMQLCLCYDKLGNPQKAMEYNQRAGKLKPTDSSYLFNKKYFETLGL